MDSSVLEEDMEISYDSRNNVDPDNDVIDFGDTETGLFDHKHETQEDYDMGEEYGGNIDPQPTAVTVTADTIHRSSTLNASTNYDDIMIDDDRNGLVNLGDGEGNKDVKVREEELLDFDVEANEDVDAEITDAPQQLIAEIQSKDQDVALLDDLDLEPHDDNDKDAGVVAAENSDDTKESHMEDDLALGAARSNTQHAVPNEASTQSLEDQKAGVANDDIFSPSPKAPRLAQVNRTPYADVVKSHNYTPTNSKPVANTEFQHDISTQKPPSPNPAQQSAAAEAQLQSPSKKRALSQVSNDVETNKKSRYGTKDEPIDTGRSQSDVPQQEIDKDYDSASNPHQISEARLRTGDTGAQTKVSTHGVDQAQSVEDPEFDVEPDRKEAFGLSGAEFDSQVGHQNTDGAVSSWMQHFSDNEDDYVDLWKHPIMVFYEGEEYELFAGEKSQVEDHHFLQDRSLVYQPLQQLLCECKDVLSGSIHEDDELEMEATDLGLIVSESSAIAGIAKLAHILHLHVHMHENDGSEDPKPLNVELRTKTNFMLRLQRLHTAVGHGYGLSQMPEVVGQGEAHFDDGYDGDNSAEAREVAEDEVQEEHSVHPEGVEKNAGEEEEHRENVEKVEDETNVHGEHEDQTVNEDQYNEHEDFGEAEEGEEAQESSEETNDQQDENDESNIKANTDEANHAYQPDAAYEDFADEFNANSNTEPATEQDTSFEPSHGTDYDEHADDTESKTISPEVAHPNLDPDEPNTDGHSADPNEDLVAPEDVIDLTEDNQNENQTAAEGYVYTDEGYGGDKDEYGNPVDEIDYIDFEDDGTEDLSSLAPPAQRDHNHAGNDDIEGLDESIYYDTNTGDHASEDPQLSTTTTTAAATGDYDDDLIDYEEDERQHAADEAAKTKTPSNTHTASTTTQPSNNGANTNGTNPDSPAHTRKRSFDIFLDGANDDQENDGGKGKSEAKRVRPA